MDGVLFWLPGGITSGILTVVICLLTAYYYYLTANFSYWSKQGVPGPKPSVIVGTLNFQKATHETEAEYYKKYGRMFGMYEGRNLSLYIAEPDLIRQVTIKDFWTFPFTRNFPVTKGDRVFKHFMTSLQGEQWKQVRSIVSPTFTTGKLKQMTHLIEECCNSLVKKHLEKFAENKEPFNVKNQISCFTLDVIASCAFGINIDSMENPNSELVVRCRELFSPKVNKLMLIVMSIMPSLLTYIPLQLIMGRSTWDYLEMTIAKVLEHKRQQKVKRRDFLELILEAKAEDNEEDPIPENKNSPKTSNTSYPSTKKVLTEEIIIAQALLFLLAGNEAASTTISHCLYCLALNPEVQEKLRKEVDQVLNETQEKLNYDSLAKMQYLDMVISETLRLYPSSSRIERTCVEDGYELNGVKLRKGTIIGIPVYSIHHDPEYYPDPEKYIPERFTTEAKAKRDPMTYLPFGSGPRNCIGMRFAQLELKMVVASIVRHYWIKRCEQTEVPLEFTTSMGFLKAKSITLAIEKRT